MTADPDILAIRRARRQAGRCLHCARRTPRAALCVECRATRRYCPRCEQTYELDAPRLDSNGRSTQYCKPCGTFVRNGPRRLSDRRADEARSENQHLPAIRRLYAAGLEYRAIAVACGLTPGGVSSIITTARRRGRWPDKLRRTKR